MSMELMVRVIREAELTRPQQGVLVAMAENAWDDGTHCFPSVDLIAWKSGYKPRNVVDIMRQLRTMGVLEVVNPARGKRATEYVIHLEHAPKKQSFDEWKQENGRHADRPTDAQVNEDRPMNQESRGATSRGVQSRVGCNLAGEGVQSHVSGVQSHVEIGEETREIAPEPVISEPVKEPEKEPPPDDAPSGAGEGTVDPVEESFARFWSAYPRRTKKPAARDAWHKLSPKPELVETILAAVADQRQSDQWTRDNGRYIPHPATWINGQRWTDELAPALSSLPKNARTHSGEQADWFGEYADERGAA